MFFKYIRYMAEPQDKLFVLNGTRRLVLELLHNGADHAIMRQGQSARGGHRSYDPMKLWLVRLGEATSDGLVERGVLYPILDIEPGHNRHACIEQYKRYIELLSGMISFEHAGSAFSIDQIVHIEQAYLEILHVAQEDISKRTRNLDEFLFLSKAVGQQLMMNAKEQYDDC